MSVTRLRLFSTFFTIGLTTFGGGYAMVAVLKEELVSKKKWICEEQFLEIVGIAESTPGPIAINMATYVGYIHGRFIGSLLATLGVCLPSFLVIFAISLFFDQFLSISWVKAAFEGIKCAIAFLILKAGFNFWKKLPRKIFHQTVFIIVTLSLLIIELFTLSFSSIYFILIGGLLGMVFLIPKEVTK